MPAYSSLEDLCVLLTVRRKRVLEINLATHVVREKLRAFMARRRMYVLNTAKWSFGQEGGEEDIMAEEWSEKYQSS